MKRHMVLINFVVIAILGVVLVDWLYMNQFTETQAGMQTNEQATTAVEPVVAKPVETEPDQIAEPAKEPARAPPKYFKSVETDDHNPKLFKPVDATE